MVHKTTFITPYEVYLNFLKTQVDPTFSHYSLRLYFVAWLVLIYFKRKVPLIGGRYLRHVRLAYQPPVLFSQNRSAINNKPSTDNSFLLGQISTTHPPTTKRTC
jgi:hypothetical protein